MLNITNILLWFLQGTSGAIAGYITNKYAVNMLFKEYTPFRIGDKVILPYKFGGVIKNRKEKFVEELSDLVERDIINGSTIKSQLNTDTFRENIKRLSYDFIDRSLKESFSTMSFTDISGFHETEEEILKFTQKNMKSCIFELAEIVAGNIKISDFINDDEINSVAEKIYNMILDEAEKGNVIKDFEKALYDSAKSVKTGDLLTENAKESVMNNIINIADEFIFNIIDDDEKIIEILNKGLELSEVYEVIDKFQIRFKEKKISDFISDKEGTELAKYIFEKIKLYLSDNGNDFVKKIIYSFIRIAEETDYTIYDFLGPEFSEKVINFINEKLPVIMPYVSEWIMNNKDELDTVIEESIDEAIGNMDPNIRKLIISKVREFFLDNVSAKNKVVDKIVSYIENYKMDNEACEELSSKIEAYLKQTKIKDVVALLEEKNIINDELMNKLGGLFINEYEKHGESFIEEVIRAFSGKTIGTVIKCDFKEIFNSCIKGKLIDCVLNNRERFKPCISTSISIFVNNKAESILSQPVGDLIPSFNINKTVKDILINNKIRINEIITKGFSEYVTKFNLYDKFVENKDLILNEITNITLDYEKNLFNKYKNREISEIIDDIPDKERISEIIGNELINYINNNCEELLKGKIKKTVYDNLIKYDEDEICDLAQRFMGNELKPLSIFGGVLGLAAGLIFGSFFNNVNIFGFYRSFSEGFLSVILMGVIGVLTNVIAITMLFKPYKKSRILSRIPFLNKFALGYIPAHKDNLGRSIGRAIDDDILNSTKIQNLFISNRENVLGYFIDYFENSNYKAVLSFIADRKNTIIEFIYKKLIKSISEDEKITHISNRICNVKIDSFVSKDLFLSLKNKIRDKKNEIVNSAAKYLFKKINTDKTIEESLSQHVLKTMNANMIKNINDNLYEEIFNNINNKSVSKILYGYKDNYNHFIDRSVDEIISTDSKESLENYIMNNAENFVFHELKDVVITVLKKKIIREFEEENNIGNLFDGKIKIFINENLNKVTDAVIDKLNNALKKNEVSIEYKVKEEVNNNLNFFEKIAYSMAGGDAIVESCVSIAVNKKIPIFINMKFYEINNLIQKSLDNAVYPMSVEELKIKADEFNVGGLLDNIFENRKNSNILSSEINRICITIINSLYNVKAVDLLKIVNLNSIESLKEKFNDDIDYVLSNLKSSLEKNKEQVLEYMDKIIKDTIVSQIAKLPVGKVLDGIKENDIYYALNFLYNKVYTNEYVKKELDTVFNNIYEDKVESTAVKDICNENMICGTVEKLVINLLSNDEILNETRKSINKAVHEAIDEKFGFINSNLRKEIANKIIDGVIDCTITNSKELIEAVNLKEVTYEQIKVMDSKEIHDLFNSFAGTFFKKLYAYGAFGAVFGINLYIPILWAIKENASTSMKNIKDGYKIKNNME